MHKYTVLLILLFKIGFTRRLWPNRFFPRLQVAFAKRCTTSVLVEFFLVVSATFSIVTESFPTSTVFSRVCSFLLLFLRISVILRMVILFLFSLSPFFSPSVSYLSYLLLFLGVSFTFSRSVSSMFHFRFPYPLFHFLFPTFLPLSISSFLFFLLRRLCFPF